MAHEPARRDLERDPDPRVGVHDRAARQTYQVRMPEVPGTQIHAVEPALPAGALAEGQSASCDIKFDIDLRGRVTRSRTP
jgi:hypothetical protein